MTDQPDTPIQSVDSLSAYEFSVEVDGQTASGIFGVRGLVSFILDGELPALTIIKMVQQDADAPFNAWIRASADGSRPTRTVAVVAMDEGVETRRWVYHNAYITQVAYSDFDTALSELVEERLTIKAQRVEEVWP